MKKSLLKSKVILELEEKIKRYGERAVEEFLYTLKDKGSPIIENLENDTEKDLVTFIYEGDKECKSVLFAPYIGTHRYKDNFRDFKMQRIMETNLWYITYEMENDIRLMYYFSPNDPLDDDWNNRFDNRVVYDKFNKKALIFKGENGEENSKNSYVIMPNAPEDIWTKRTEGIPRGNVEEYKFESENLDDKRRIRVYTPYGYDRNKKPYGFMVLTDGDEYIYLLSAIETLDNLIASKKIPPIVAIFIDSHEKTREKELECNDSFCRVITKELISWIRQSYNISKSPEEAIICGLSLGGLTAAYLGLNYSEVFGNVLSQSGSYWYKPEGFSADNNDCWMSIKFKEINKLPLKFYLNIGVFEWEHMIKTNLNLRDALLSKGYSVDFQWFNSSHDYLSWGGTLADGLISLMGK